MGRAPEWLCLDFNCAMYYVLRKMRPIGAAEGRGAWEGEFADAIAAYMRQLVELAKPTRGVYVSCDGVVCAAKRRQQRMRRFRGPWFAAAEGEARLAQEGPKDGDGDSHGPTWDQNALTPGTAFMERLGGVLEAMGRRIAAASGGVLDVRVSTTAEPGEGEHKLLAAMRGLPVAPRTVTIYGLDADLILLAALLGADTGAEVLLMREAQEFERGGPDDEWRHLNVRGLVEAIIGSKGEGVADRVRDWVAAMSLLGNDFLPRSLTRTVRDGGIPALLGALRDEVWSEGRQLVGADGRLSRAALLALLRVWAATEEADMAGAVREAVRQARRSTGALEEWQSSPARWCSLGRLGVGAPMGSETGSGVLKPTWRRVYREVWRAGPAADYLAGLAWVWDYYSGRDVCLGWCYDHHLPPLWGDLVAALEAGGGRGGATIEPPPVRWAEPLPAWTHLLSVLPAESVVTLLPVERGARFVAAEPWWWPASWSLFDVGRGQMWECEAVLPLVPESTLRRWAGGATATTTAGGATATTTVGGATATTAKAPLA